MFRGLQGTKKILYQFHLPHPLPGEPKNPKIISFSKLSFISKLLDIKHFQDKL